MRRDHSEKEIYQKLGRRYEKSAITKAIHKADEYGYIKTPKELALRFAEYLHNRDRGQLKIKLELSKKGLKFEGDFDKDRELAKARTHVDKIHNPGDDLNLKRQQKIMRYLANRGFTGETIKSVIGLLKNEKRGSS